MPMNPRLLRPRSTIHPEAAAWANRVRANGGSVSGLTLNAVSRFCASIAAAGIRDRFYRLNLFCGTGLTACLVPLYRGQSLGGTQFGGTTDTNTGPFVSGDYAETGASGGLDGDGVGKWLETGLTYDAMGVPATGHLSVFKQATTWDQRELIGANDSDDLYYLQTRLPFAGVYAINAVVGRSTFINLATISTGASHLVASRTSATSLVVYENASQVAVNTTSATPGTCSHQFLVFNRNSNGTAGVVPWPHRLMGYSIGLGMTATQVSAYNSAMQAFQTALSRNV
jgi:hypothetical protein